MIAFIAVFLGLCTLLPVILVLRRGRIPTLEEGTPAEELGALPGQPAIVRTLMGVLIAQWKEQGDSLTPGTLVTAMRIRGTARADARLAAMVSALEVSSAGYGDVVRLEMDTSAPLVTDHRIVAEMAGRALALTVARARSYEDALAAFAELAATPGHVATGALGPLLENTAPDPALRVIAKTTSEWADPGLQIWCARVVGDMDQLAALAQPGATEAKPSRAAMGARDPALRALRRVDPARAAEVARWRLDRARGSRELLALDVLAKHGGPGDVAVLESFLSKRDADHLKTDPDVSRAVIVAAVGLTREDATGAARVAPFIASLIGQDLTLTGLACGALAGLGSRAGNARLRALLENGSNRAQALAASWLGRLGNYTDIAPLAALRDRRLESPGVREAATDAIRLLQAGRGSEVGGLSLSPEGSGAGGLSIAGEAGSLTLPDAKPPNGQGR